MQVQAFEPEKFLKGMGFMDEQKIEIKKLEAKSIELQVLQREKAAESVALILHLDDLIEKVNLQIIELSK